MLKSIMSKKQRIGVQEVWSGSVVQSYESNVKNITFLTPEAQVTTKKYFKKLFHQNNLLSK